MQEINGKNIVYNTLMTTKTGLLIKTYQGLASGKDTIDENFYGLKARYVRLVNEEESSCMGYFL